MAKEEDVLEGIENEEDLLDFDLEDITPETLGEEGDSEEEIIDLVDLVEEGKGGQVSGDDEIANLLEEDQPQAQEEDISIATDEISEIPDILEEQDSEVPMTGTGVADLSLSDLELDEPADETAVSEDVPGETEAGADVEELDLGLDDEGVPDEERPEADIPDIDLSGVFGDEQESEAAPEQGSAAGSDDNIEEMLGETIEATVAEEVASGEDMSEAVVPEEESAPAEPADEMVSLEASAGVAAISPEKIESIVRDVVEEVVERVTRETMSEVAERVITEAIDALKQNLETTSE